MPSPSPEALALAERYAVAVPERLRRGAGGELLGQGVGSSIEFQDRRDYVAGDDVRHLDWAAYARTDQLMVRLYREEVQPRIELLVDASASMATDPGKLALSVDLAGLIARAAAASSLPVRVVLLGDGPRELGTDELVARGFDAEGRLPLSDAVRDAGALLRPGALRFLVSDCLFPGDPAQVVRALAARAGSLAVCQVLSEQDAAPEVGQALRLTDAETGETLDLVLDEAATRRYRERLARLETALATEVRRAGGMHVRCVAGPSIDEHCRDELVPAGILVPR